MKPFAICLGVLAILLINVMDLFSVAGGSLLAIPCIVFHRMFVYSSDPCECLDSR